MSTIAQMVLYDLATNRPSASIAGRVFYASDTKEISRDNGSSWDDVTPSGGGSVVLLESHTASNSATLDFTTWQNSAYDVYDIYVEDLTWSGSTFLSLRFSTDGGSSYDAGNNYQWAGNYSYDSGASDNGGFAGSFSASSTASIQVVNSNSVDANTGLMAYVRLYTPQSTLYKQVQYENSFISGGTLVSTKAAGIYKNTTAVNALRFILGTGNIVSGTIRIYGVKNT